MTGRGMREKVGRVKRARGNKYGGEKGFFFCAKRGGGLRDTGNFFSFDNYNY